MLLFFEVSSVRLQVLDYNINKKKIGIRLAKFGSLPKSTQKGLSQNDEHMLNSWEGVANSGKTCKVTLFYFKVFYGRKHLL